MSAKGTGHHRLQGVTGIVVIVLLPVILFAIMQALGNGPTGLARMFQTLWSAVAFGVFLTAAIWYCKLQFDEVIMDYFDGGLRTFSSLANTIIAILIWVISVFAIWTF